MLIAKAHALSDHLDQRLDFFWVISAMSMTVLIRYEQGSIFQFMLLCLGLGAMLLYPAVVRSEKFWFFILSICAVFLILQSFDKSIHSYLMTYWVFGIFLSFFSTDQRRYLKSLGISLAGLTFLFASIWKFLSPDFSNGVTLHYLLISSFPLGLTGSIFSGLRIEDVRENIERVSLLIERGSESFAVLHSTDRVSILAIALTRLTQIIESILALILIMPPSIGVARYKEYAILVFFFLGYAFVPVGAFACTLAIFGYAMAGSSILRLAYMAFFFIFQFSDFFISIIAA